jgi:NADPH:quinone reductase-like Zn-dependent oxidoreductase
LLAAGGLSNLGLPFPQIVSRCRRKSRCARSARISHRPRASGEQLAAIANLIVKGTVKVKVETVLPLPEAHKAQELSKPNHSGGKIVLEVNGRENTPGAAARTAEHSQPAHELHRN